MNRQLGASRQAVLRGQGIRKARIDSLGNGKRAGSTPDHHAKSLRCCLQCLFVVSLQKLQCSRIEMLESNARMPIEVSSG